MLLKAMIRKRIHSDAASGQFSAAGLRALALLLPR
jgi:hypothetical protein